MDETAPLLGDKIVASNHDKWSENNDQINKLKDEHSVKFKDLHANSSCENDVLLSNTSCQTYWYRWYICLVFGVLGLFQGAIYNTWGPLNESAKAAFGFSSDEIELLTNWGPIAFIATVPFFMWLLNNKGLRISAVLTAFLVAFGAGLKCLPFEISILRYFIHIGQILNGIGSCVVTAAPAYLSSLWFPPHERVTATSIGTLISYLGPGVIYFIGMIVDVPSNSSINYTVENKINDASGNDTCLEIIHIRKQIMTILYVQFGLTMLVFVSMLIFFPNRPPKPPSITAALPRIDLKAGLLKLRKNKQFWFVSIFTSLVVGAWSGWSGVMPIILKPLNISQSECGLLGLVMSVSGIIIGVPVGWLTDRLKGKTKLMLIMLLSLAFLDFVYFLIISNKWIHVAPFLPTHAEIWVVLIILASLIKPSIPLIMEMVSDAGYPVNEGTSTAILLWLMNVVSFIFIFLVGILPSPLDCSYIIFASLLIALPALIFFTDGENRRLKLDNQNHNVEQNTGTYGSNVNERNNEALQSRAEFIDKIS